MDFLFILALGIVLVTGSFILFVRYRSGYLFFLLRFFLMFFGVGLILKAAVTMFGV
ncbi:hypothetical protein ACM26V_03925 [Salipaludibacillus sp. HK11]|uniref:hypothetical protein n=1 Tax=Salipaludibacillus sp. HK11 TaxID=3394320 RepID=UPI0039FBF003